MKAYLCSANDGNGSWIPSGRQGRRQGTKPASGKIANFLNSYSYSRKNVYSMTAHSWTQILLYKSHQRVALTREYVLLGKKGIYGRTNEFEKKTRYTGWNQCVRTFATAITPYGQADSVVLYSIVEITRT